MTPGHCHRPDACPVATALDMTTLLAQDSFDLILLDLGLPDGDGLALTRRLRAESSVPLMVLTVRRQREDRLTIAHALADSLVEDNRRQDAIDVLEPALAEHRAANGGKRTWSAVDTLRLYAEQIGAGGNFVRAEAVYRQELPQAANAQVAAAIRQSIHRLQVSALDADGSTSLGRGLPLYQGAQRQLLDECGDVAGLGLIVGRALVRTPDLVGVGGDLIDRATGDDALGACLGDLDVLVRGLVAAGQLRT